MCMYVCVFIYARGISKSITGMHGCCEQTEPPSPATPHSPQRKRQREQAALENCPTAVEVPQALEWLLKVHWVVEGALGD